MSVVWDTLRLHVKQYFKLPGYTTCHENNLRWKRGDGGRDGDCDSLVVYARADVRRVACLQDIRVSVEPICRSIRPRRDLAYQIKLEYRTNRWSWTVGRDYGQVRAFHHDIVTYLLYRADLHSCAHCRGLCRDILRFRLPLTASYAQRRQLIRRFLSTLLEQTSALPKALVICDSVLQCLRQLEQFLEVQYLEERKALSAIRALQNMRLPPNEGGATECPICLLPFSQEGAVGLPCGHMFHDTCICVWFHSQINCPICREDHVELSRIPEMTRK